MVILKSSLKCEANFKVKLESFIHGWLRSGLRKHHASGEKYLAINLMKNAKLGNITQAKQLLNEIKRRFPNTGVANLADTKLLQLN